ncbi:MAG: hypothetical protein DRN04_07675 [Thermoprotei archaeon]|nr:MAG: hypothetical protein DRN04_07675 [Thermoprotei archaeon]
MVGKNIAVFDIGKTNKKFTVFDEELNVAYTTSTKIEEKKTNGIICDDVDAINSWVLSVLDSALSRFNIGSIVFTTFGATVVLLDAEDKLAFPVVSYNQEIEPEVRQKFFEEYGSPEELYVRTGTPPLGQLLNVGLQLYWIKNEFPEVYEKTKTILFLPEYFSFILSGGKATEITSVGCHTYLYDIVDKDWSIVAKGLDVPEKSPPFYNVWDCIGKYKGVKVAAGIHDSNASLVPFLLAEKKEFVLASTGTWCVFMYPSAEYSPAKEDVYRDILYYIDVYGRPIKSARFKCGYEFEYYINITRKRFNVDPLKIPFDEKLAVKIIKEQTAYVVPTLTPGTGQFPCSKGRIVKEKEFFRDPATAYHVLNLSLAAQTYFALSLLTRGKKGLRILVQGGFAKNPHYLRYLATLMPYNTIVYYKYTEATSLGAALVGKAALEDKSLKDLDVELPQLESIEVKRLSIDDKYVEEYLESFKELCEKNSI